MAKSTKPITLNAPRAREGVKIAHSLHVSEIPYRKLNMDTFHEVRFARKPIIITDYGKRLAIILPLADNDVA
jgi:hypothetical protein